MNKTEEKKRGKKMDDHGFIIIFFSIGLICFLIICPTFTRNNRGLDGAQTGDWSRLEYDYTCANSPVRRKKEEEELT
jgi:hypothetical protein